MKELGPGTGQFPAKVQACGCGHLIVTLSMFCYLKRLVHKPNANLVNYMFFSTKVTVISLVVSYSWTGDVKIILVDSHPSLIRLSGTGSAAV